MDVIDDSDDSSSSEELTTSNLNGNSKKTSSEICYKIFKICLQVTCKNCNLTVECHNCTQSDKDTQSTIPMQLSSQDNQQFTSSPSPTPTIPAPERVVEILSNNVSPESVATASQNILPTTAVTGAKTEEQTAPSQAPNTKAIENTDQTIGYQANTSTDESLNSSDEVTSGNEKQTTT